MIIAFLILVAAMLAPLSGQAFHILLHGVVTDHFTGEPVKGITVVLVKDCIERESVTTPWNGRYELYLERGYAYEVHYKRPGYVTKFVSIDATEIPLFPDVPFFEMDLQMSMFEAIDDYDLSAFDTPVGRAEYKHSVRNLNWDVEYTQARRTELIRVMIGYERELQARKQAARAEKRKGTSKKRKLVHF